MQDLALCQIFTIVFWKVKKGDLQDPLESFQITLPEEMNVHARSKGVHDDDVYVSFCR